MLVLRRQGTWSRFDFSHAGLSPWTNSSRKRRAPRAGDKLYGMVQTRVGVELPAELVKLLDESPLGDRDRSARVRMAVIIHLFLVGEISLGKAAELAGETRTSFEAVLLQLGLPSVQYTEKDFRDDLDTLERLRSQSKNP